MAWLVRIELGAEDIRRLRINDSYLWHQKLWTCYPSSQDQKRDFLSRIDILDGGIRVWMLAHREPIRPDWCPMNAFQIRNISESFLSHKYYAFDLVANPVESVVQVEIDGTHKLTADGKRMRSRRRPLIKDKELREWIYRKGNMNGFSIVDLKPLEISPMIESHFSKKGNHGYHGSVRFRGLLEVMDSEKFAEAYHNGIGSAKAFGFGLMLLFPIS